MFPGAGAGRRIGRLERQHRPASDTPHHKPPCATSTPSLGVTRRSPTCCRRSHRLPGCKPRRAVTPTSQPTPRSFTPRPETPTPHRNPGTQKHHPTPDSSKRQPPSASRNILCRSAFRGRYTRWHQPVDRSHPATKLAPRAAKSPRAPEHRPGHRNPHGQRETRRAGRYVPANRSIGGLTNRRQEQRHGDYAETTAITAAGADR